MSEPSTEPGVAAADTADALLHWGAFFDRLHDFLHGSVHLPSGKANVEAVGRMADFGLATAAQITAFLDQAAQVSADTATNLSGWSMPDTVPELTGDPTRVLLAVMLFSDEELAGMADAGHDPLAWLDAVVTIGRAARARGDATALPLGDPDHGEHSAVLNALRAAMTPADLVTHAAQLAAQGVCSGDLAQAIGTDAVPPDLLAADPDATEHLNEIRTGSRFHTDGPSRITPADAAVVLRELHTQGGQLKEAVADARLLVSAGAADAATVLDLHPLVRAGKLSRELIGRAAREKLTPQQWLPLLEQIGDRAAAYKNGMLLPLRTLAEASQAGVSVRAWDENRRALGSLSTYSACLDAVRHAPWDDVYPDGQFAGRVVELAKAGVSPGLLAECHGFFAAAHALRGQHQPPGWTGKDSMVDDVLTLHAAGLTLPVITELGRKSARQTPIVMTVAQVLAALEAGMTLETVRMVREQGGGLKFAGLLMTALAPAGGERP